MVPNKAANIRVIAAVVRRGDRLHFCHRPPHERHGGPVVPRRQFEPGKPDEDAALELLEELGVEALGSVRKSSPSPILAPHSSSQSYPSRSATGAIVIGAQR
jgi:hypothetical protein